MRRPSFPRLGRVVPWLAVMGLGLLCASAFSLPSVSEAGADVLDPTLQKTIAIGNGSAPWSTDRGSAQRNARVASFPTTAKRKWKRSVGGAITFPPLVSGEGTVVVLVPGNGGGSSESTLVEVSIADGAPTRAVRLGDVAAAAPVLLASGMRVVVTGREAVGVEANGTVRFRTPFGGSIATTGRAAVVPLPNGGFSVARAGDLLELDSSGVITGRARLDVTLALAARSNGETVAVSPNGELYVWRAGKVPRLVGAFSDKILLAGGVTQVCPFGPVIDGEPGSGPGKRRERVLCGLGSETLVEQIELATGTRRAVLAPPIQFLHFRTALAVGRAGDLAVGSNDGTVTGLSSSGLGYGPVDVPGAVGLLGGFGKDAGFVGVTPQGEIAPMVADDGSVLFGSNEGIAIAHPSGLVTRITRCNGSSLATVAGVASAGPSTLLVACTNGDLELIAEGALPAPLPAATTDSTITPIDTPTSSSSLLPSSSASSGSTSPSATTSATGSSPTVAPSATGNP